MKRPILAVAAAAGALMLGGGIAHADDPAPAPAPPGPAPTLSPGAVEQLNKAYADYVTWPCGLSIGTVNGFPAPQWRYKQCPPDQPSAGN